MIESPDRIERFHAEIAEMKLRTGRANREGALLALSIVLMIAGIVIAFAAYRASLVVDVTPGSNVDVLDSNSYTPLAITGLAVSVVGGALFLRYSLARFFRFWLLRQSYEQQAAIEAVASKVTG